MEADIRPIVEAILFASEDPVTPESLKKVFPALTLEELVRVLEDLFLEYEHAKGRGFHIRKVKGGYQFRTKPVYSQWVLKYQEAKPQKLSRAALEVLAIIAYRQPITRPEIENIRGVDSSGALKSLIEKNLVKTSGRKDVPGRPLMYVTTSRFLEVFGLNSLEDLPPLKEEEIKERAAEAGALQSLFSNDKKE